MNHSHWLPYQAAVLAGVFVALFSLYRIFSGPVADDLTTSALPPSVRENPASYRPIVVVRPSSGSGYSGSGGYSGGK